MATSTYVFIQDSRNGEMAVEQLVHLTASEVLDALGQHDDLVQVLEMEWRDSAGGIFSDLSEDLATAWLDREYEAKGDILLSAIPAFVMRHVDWEERARRTPAPTMPSTTPLTGHSRGGCDGQLLGSGTERAGQPRYG